MAAGGGAGDGLAVGVVFHIAGGPHAFDIGGTHVVGAAAAGFQVAGGVHIELAFEDFGVGLVADGDKHAAHGQVFAAAVFIEQARAGYAHVVAENVFQRGVELEDDFAFGYALH